MTGSKFPSFISISYTSLGVEMYQIIGKKKEWPLAEASSHTVHLFHRVLLSLIKSTFAIIRHAFFVPSKTTITAPFLVEKNWVRHCEE